MNKRFDQLNNRLNETDTRVNQTKSLAENNTSRLEQLEEESKITNLKLEEYSGNTEQLEEFVDDQINRNARSTPVIRGVKFNLCNEKSWNDTENVLATTLCTQFGWNKDQFAHDIEQVHCGNYENLNSPTYAKFLSWKVAFKANRESKITIFAIFKSTLKKCKTKWTHYFWKERNSNKMSSEKHGRVMLSFREYWCWKSQQIKNAKFLTVIFEMPFWYCDVQVYSSPGLDVGGFRDAQCFLGICIQSVYLNAHGFLRFVPWHAVNPAHTLNLGDLCMLWSNSNKSGVIIHRIEESSTSIDECFTKTSSRLLD